MFSNSNNLVFTGGQFTEVMLKGTRGIERLEKASAPAAIHNSGERFDPPKCHPNTRVAVIEQIMYWILSQENSEALIMWLFGPAGSGKSAIAQTLAERCYASGILLASFFFSRSDPSRNHFRSLFATIAYQVVVNFPDSRDIITRVPEQDPLVLTQSFEIQLISLIIGPLQQLYLAGRPPASSDPYLIVIDGLDECADPQVQVGILRSIAKAVKRCQFPLKFLFASRPELHLTTEFNSRTINPILSRLALDDKFLPDDDIRMFLQDKCDEIRRTHPLKRFLSPTWPSTDIIERLVAKSSGQFIYVSTVVKFITSTRRHPDDSLNVILSPRPSEHNLPFSELDALYANVLSSVADLNKTLTILGFLIVCENLYLTMPAYLEDFLMLRAGEAELFVGELASVATIRKHAGKEFVTLLHASLGDFILEQSRSKQFALSPTIIHAYLAHLCFQSIKRYQSRGDSVNENSSPQGYVHRYACENLTKHCSVAAPTVLLRNEILEFSSESWYEHSGQYMSYIETIPAFLLCIRKMPFRDAEFLYVQHRTTFEKYLESQLPKYYSNPALTFLVASLLTPVQLPALYDDKESIIDFLGSGEPAKSLLELDRNGLKLLLLFSYGRLCGDQYRSFFTSYLHAPARSGQNVFDGKRYTVAALECLKYLHQDRDRNTPTTGNPIPKLFPWALQCLPILLDRAAITGALVQSVRRHRFSQRSKEFSNDESAAKLGISRLLLRKPRTFIHDLLPNSK